MSVRMGVNELADRWKRVAKALPGEDRVRAERIVAMAKRHSSELFYGLDDPLEAAAFSVLIEILKEQDLAREERGTGKPARAGHASPDSASPAEKRAGEGDPAGPRAESPGDTGQEDRGDTGQEDRGDTGREDRGDTGREDRGDTCEENPGDTGQEDRGVDP